MKNHRTLKSAALAVAMLPGAASAFTIYDTFGSFPEATWGGTGIPTDAVAASKQILDGENTLTIALSATERYSNPPVGDNGAAIYTAQAGSNCGVATDPIGCPSTSQGALWNYNFYMDIEGGGVLTDYQINLYIDIDPAGPNSFGDLTGLLNFDVTQGLIDNGLGSLTLYEDSQNLMFLPFPGFDPNALGNYQFAMTVTRSGFSVDTIAMEVNVVPIPAAAWLFGSALLGLCVVKRRNA